MSRLPTSILDLLWRASMLALMLVTGLIAAPAVAEQAPARFEAQCGVGEVAVPELWLKVSLDVGYTEVAEQTPATPCELGADEPAEGEEACSKLPQPAPAAAEAAPDALPRYVPASLSGEPDRLPAAPPSACWATSTPDKCHASPPMPTPLELQATHAFALVSDFALPRAQLLGAQMARPRAPTARVMGRLLGPQQGVRRALLQPPQG